MIWTTYIFKRSKSIQELNLPDVDASGLEEVLPISKSAIHSCNLVKKQSSCHDRYLKHLLLQAAPLPPSPCETVDEKEAFADEAFPQARCPTLPVDPDSQLPERISLLVLQQTPADEKFTFGSSTQSDVVLEAATDSLEIDWVNLCHCVLHPDPDSASMILHNSSRCEFWVRRLAAENRKKVVEPGFKLLISEGTWHLNLGRGFDFQTHVLGHFKRWNEIHNTLMTSMELSAPYRRRMLRERWRPTSNVQSPPQKPS